MKLIRWGNPGDERPGLLTDGGERKDCTGFFADWDRAFFADDGLAALVALAALDLAALADVPADARWAAPVARPGKVLCIGLNYRAHAAESGSALPREPLLFTKAPNAACGPFDPLIIPRGSTATDYEVELAVVIGRECRYLEDPLAAAAVVAGYCVANDVSERHFQKACGGQWVKGKSSDHFLPLGPFLVTPDELVDPQDLVLESRVDGQLRQSSTTADMIFDHRFIVQYLSRFMTLEPGDVICTGTPAGVGMGMEPPGYLRAGQTVELTVAGLGSQRQVCIDDPR